jgi:hypothetical protein
VAQLRDAHQRRVSHPLLRRAGCPPARRVTSTLRTAPVRTRMPGGVGGVPEENSQGPYPDLLLGGSWDGGIARLTPRCHRSSDAGLGYFNKASESALRTLAKFTHSASLRVEYPKVACRSQSSPQLVLAVALAVPRGVRHASRHERAHA